MIKVCYSELDGPKGLSLRLKPPVTRATRPPGRTSYALAQAP